MAKGDTTTMLAIAAVGAATGGFALPALAAAGTATAAGTAATAAATGFSWMGAMSGIGAALSAGSAIFGGNAEAEAMKVRESQAQLELAGEQTQAALEEEDRQRRLRSALSTQASIFGASNISSSGVGDIIARDTIGTVNRETDLKTTLSRINQTQLKNSAAGYRSAASSARVGGYVKAGAGLATFAGQKFEQTRTT